MVHMSLFAINPSSFAVMVWCSPLSAPLFDTLCTKNEERKSRSQVTSSQISCAILELTRTQPPRNSGRNNGGSITIMADARPFSTTWQQEAIETECLKLIECDADGCTRTNPVHQCDNCQCVYYCSRECQQHHWESTHRHDCPNIDDMRSDIRSIADGVTSANSCHGTTSLEQASQYRQRINNRWCVHDDGEPVLVPHPFSRPLATNTNPLARPSKIHKTKVMRTMTKA